MLGAVGLGALVLFQPIDALPGGVPRPPVDPPPGASSEAAFAAAIEASDKALTLGAQVGLSVDVRAALESCRLLREAKKKDAALEACSLALRQLFDETARERPDPLRRALAGRLGSLAADAAARIGRLARRQDGTGPGAVTGRIDARFDLLPDRRTLRVQPLVPLVAGRRYGLVVERGGRPAEVSDVLPRGETSPEVPRGAFAELLAGALVGNQLGFEPDAVAELAARLEAEAHGGPGFDVFAGFVVRLAEPLEASEIGSLDARFVPARALHEGEAVHVFRTVDWPRGLAPAVAAARQLGCVDVPSREIGIDGFFWRQEPGVARLVEGHWLAPAPPIDPAFGPIGGAASAPARRPSPTPGPVDLRWLAALPKDAGPATPVVLTIDGHAGRAERMLRRFASALTERGIALVAIDLPEHGARGNGGAGFFEPLDPARLGARLLESVVDVVAAVHALHACGLPLAGGAFLRPERVGYLGYSLGAMVGVMARAVEPALGAMVALAPGGDVTGWLMLHISSRLGASFMTCLDGPEHGRSCQMNGRCAAPGLCAVDPFQWEFASRVAMPYALAGGGVDPLAFASRRTGAVSHGPLLLIGGGLDYVIYPNLMGHLADGLGLHPAALGVWRGPRARRVQWPELGHDLVEQPAVREQAVMFLAERMRAATPGRRRDTRSHSRMGSADTTGLPARGDRRDIGTQSRASLADGPCALAPVGRSAGGLDSCGGEG